MYLGQAWKLDNTTLINKGGIWRSANEWNFIPNDDGTIYIETTSDVTKVLVVKGDEVVPEVKDSNKKGQLWIEGEKMAGGYTTLKNYESSKILTATASGLKAKGNYHHTGLQYCNIRATLEKRLHSFLADVLTLFQPGWSGAGADYALHLGGSPQFLGLFYRPEAKRYVLHIKAKSFLNMIFLYTQFP